MSYMSILRIKRVPCCYFCDFHVIFKKSAMSLVDSKKKSDVMILVFFIRPLGSTLHVNFKK